MTGFPAQAVGNAADHHAADGRSRRNRGKMSRGDGPRQPVDLGQVGASPETAKVKKLPARLRLTRVAGQVAGS